MNIKQFVNTIIAAFTKPHSTAPTTEEASAAWELEWHAGNSERQPQQERPAGTAAFLEDWDEAGYEAAEQAWKTEFHAGYRAWQPQQERPAGTAAFLEGWDKAAQSAALWEADEGPVNYDPVRYDDEFFPQ